MSAAIMMSAGAAVIIDTQTVTRGSHTAGSDPHTEYVGFSSLTPSFGSISDGTANALGGATIVGLYFTQIHASLEGYVSRQVVLRVSTEIANSGFASVVIGDTKYNRADAYFSSGSGFAQWTWDIPIENRYISEGDPFNAASTLARWY